MNRKIKFRAWCKVDAMMYVDVQNGIVFDDGSNYSFDRFINKSHDDYHDWCLMQFTGLKDCNGKEIFEGDIVRLVEPNRLYTVEWLEYAFKLVHADPKLERMHWGNLQRVGEMNWGMLVTGNIYENPELLQP